MCVRFEATTAQELQCGTQRGTVALVRQCLRVPNRQVALTLSASTRKMPKSSSIAHCVTILRWSTRRIAGADWSADGGV